MPNKMLIDATHPEETRVVVVRGNRVEEFDFESAQRKQLRGNIYLAKVTRVEPSLQAAFVEYGGNRHGFLAFSEIHPDYYQIPVADRQALIEAEERAHREAEEETENRSSRRRSRHRNARRRGNGERVRSEVIEAGPEEADALLPQDAVPADGQPQDVEAAHPARDDAQHAASASDDYSSTQDSYAQDYSTHDNGEPAAEAADQPVSALESEEPAVAAAPEFIEEQAGGDREPRDESGAGDANGRGDEVAPDGDDHHHDHHDDDHDHHDELHADDANGDENGEDDGDDSEEEAEEDEVESVGGDDVLEEVPERAFRPRRQYKIQEVIKRRQVMLVQVVKEERGNKGAALTTYLSLAGRYAVLMPNTARGGGISRKITSAQDRNRLKDVVQDLDVPEGMGVILRTAGASRTKPEIKRDFEYLLRMWETVRDLTLRSQAPTLVYEEGSLVKRSLRDLYNKDIDEVLVAGEAGYREARDFMKMLMPSNVRAVKQYRDGQPLFSRMGVESQLDAMFSPTVTLRSGGYIVINQTEALVSIDVNSGRSTREHHIEDTALKTNLEAAEEVARQLRLRDLAGLIVIDFIDMDEKRNNRAVERKLSDCLRQDRARIQVGRISHFGLLEMSRQRIRASVLESSTEPCPHCGGTGHVRSVSSVALQLLRGLEEILMKGPTHNLIVRTRTEVALYVLNHKRGHLRDLENSFKVSLSIIADPTVSGQQAFAIERADAVHTLEAAKAILAAQVATAPAIVEEADDYGGDETFEAEVEFEGDDETGIAEDAQSAAEPSAADGEEGPRRKRRRRRRGGRGEARDSTADQDEAPDLAPQADAAGDGSEDDGEAEDADGEARMEGANGERRPRRRGRRGGRRRRSGGEAGDAEAGQQPVDGIAASIADDFGPLPQSEAMEAEADLSARDMRPPHEQPAAAPAPHAEASAEEVSAAEVSAEEAQPESEAAPRKRSTVREKVSIFFGDEPAEPEPQAASSEPQAASAPSPDEPASPPQPSEPASEAPAPRRAGWWSRRSE